jgi:hypothetical protein
MPLAVPDRFDEAIKILSTNLNLMFSQDSSVSIETDCGLDNQGLIPSKGKIYFS